VEEEGARGADGQAEIPEGEGSDRTKLNLRFVIDPVEGKTRTDALTALLGAVEDKAESILVRMEETSDEEENEDFAKQEIHREHDETESSLASDNYTRKTRATGAKNPAPKQDKRKGKGVAKPAKRRLEYDTEDESEQPAPKKSRRVRGKGETSDFDEEDEDELGLGISVLRALRSESKRTKRPLRSVMTNKKGKGLDTDGNDWSDMDDEEEEEEEEPEEEQEDSASEVQAKPAKVTSQRFLKQKPASIMDRYGMGKKAGDAGAKGKEGKKA
jgi:hypothetical protein